MTKLNDPLEPSADKPSADTGTFYDEEELTGFCHACGESWDDLGHYMFWALPAEGRKPELWCSRYPEGLRLNR